MSDASAKQDLTSADVPTLQSVVQDSVHGSAWISLRALDVLRFRAAQLASSAVDDKEAVADLRRLALRLQEARPTMVSILNRVQTFLDRAEELERDGENDLAGRLEAVARELRREGEAAESKVIAAAAKLVEGRCVLTLSRSSTVISALKQARPRPRVVVAESLPGGEGRGVALELAEEGLEVTLIPDAVIAAALAPEWTPAIDLVVVGADTVSHNGDVVNKSGTRVAALAARAGGIPCYAVCTKAKLSQSPELHIREPDKATPAQRGKPRRVEPVFELTSAELFTALVTEEGLQS